MLGLEPKADDKLLYTRFYNLH